MTSMIKKKVHFKIRKGFFHDNLIVELDSSSTIRLSWRKPSLFWLIWDGFRDQLGCIHLTAAVCTAIWYYSTVTHMTAPRFFYKNASILLCLSDGITGTIKRKHVHIANTICQLNSLFKILFLVFRIYNKHVHIVTYWGYVSTYMPNPLYSMNSYILYNSLSSFQFSVSLYLMIEYLTQSAWNKYNSSVWWNF